MILPLDLAPLELQKPTANVSWRSSFQSLTFKKVTIFLLELESVGPGYLEALELEITINGRTTINRYETRDYFFEAPTQLGLLVDTAARKIDGSTDIHILIKPQWSLLEAGVRLVKAQLCSFDPRPSGLGEKLSRVPLIVEWNSYYLGSTPPFSLQFSTTAYFGNASGSNQLRINCYLEVLGTESPWIDFSLDEERIYQGDEASQWINTTINPATRNLAYLPLTVEFHPHRIDDRHKEVTIRLEVYAVFEEFIDPREIQREEKLANMPEIPAIIANVLTLNAVLLPLLYFRKQRLAEREGRTSVLKRQRAMAQKRNLDFLSRKHDTERF